MKAKEKLLTECKNRISRRHEHVGWDILSEQEKSKYHNQVCLYFASVLAEKHDWMILKQSELITKLYNLLVDSYGHKFYPEGEMEKLRQDIFELKKELGL